jgi:hypothetical protein
LGSACAASPGEGQTEARWRPRQSAPSTPRRGQGTPVPDGRRPRARHRPLRAAAERTASIPERDYLTAKAARLAAELHRPS